jgi:hypothetical protein
MMSHGLKTRSAAHLVLQCLDPRIFKFPYLAAGDANEMVVVSIAPIRLIVRVPLARNRLLQQSASHQQRYGSIYRCARDEFSLPAQLMNELCDFEVLPHPEGFGENSSAFGREPQSLLAKACAQDFFSILHASLERIHLQNQLTHSIYYNSKLMAREFIGRLWL